MKLDKPMFLGLCVLDISKIVLASWYDADINSKYGKHAMLFHSDTYISSYLSTTYDAYAVLMKDNDMLDDRRDPTYHTFEHMHIIGKHEHGAAITNICNVPGALKYYNIYHVCKHGCM